MAQTFLSVSHRRQRLCHWWGTDVAVLEFRCDLIRSPQFRLQAEFTCDEGVTALCGPSGSGKTTILSLIAGLARPQAGRIQLNDRVLTDAAAGIQLPPERRNVGLVFQDGCLFPHLTVRQNLEYGWRRRSQRRGDVEHLVEVLEIGEFLNRAPLTLSGGEKQRVALGRALLQHPDFLLLDEPLTALDEPLQARIVTYLKRALDEYAVPTLMVTHNLDHARELARAAWLIRDGKIVAGGAPDDVLAKTNRTN